MARVFFNGRLAELAGRREIELKAATVRELKRLLEQQIPVLSGELSEGMAIAIDGEIINDPLLQPLGDDSEVHFIPAIGAG